MQIKIFAGERSKIRNTPEAPLAHFISRLLLRLCGKEKVENGSE